MSVSVVAVVPVRMGSSRLPGKTLRPLAGKPLLGHLLDRLACCARLDGVVVATSVNPENDPIDAYCASRGVACFRGAEDDVLGPCWGPCRGRGRKPACWPLATARCSTRPSLIPSSG